MGSARTHVPAVAHGPLVVCGIRIVRWRDPQLQIIGPVLMRQAQMINEAYAIEFQGGEAFLHSLL